MRHILIIIIFSFILTFSAQSQNVLDTSREGFLKHGIYFENFGFTLPWLFDLTDTAKYGHPKVVRANWRRLDLSWDSVEVFNGVKVNFIYPVYKNIFKKGYSRLTNIWATIHASDFIKIKRLLDRYTPPNRLKSDEENIAVYTLQHVRIWLERHHKKFGNFIQIQKIE